jgi:PAT family beta-lactamase induction signal transducer AmpG
VGHPILAQGRQVGRLDIHGARAHDRRLSLAGAWGILRRMKTAAARASAERVTPLRKKLYWVGLFYFAEGFPFGVANDLLPVYFRTAGVSLKDIGLLSLLGLPWSLKVLWSPLIDRFGDRRAWIGACNLAMAAVLLSLPFFPPGAIGWTLRALLLSFTVLSATQDIAIDAFTVGLMSRGQEGPANSVRVAAYRAAIIVAGGGVVALSTTLSWSLLFRLAALLPFILGLAALRAPRVAITAEARRAVFRPLWFWLRRPGALAVFLFILTYKVGDASMGPMVKPFWLDRGLTTAEVGLISTTVGMLASVAGALIGGIWVARLGIYRGLWLLGILQALSNLGYAVVAWADLGRGFVYAASVLESLTGGLGTAAFLSFLMNVCDREHAAVQYALLSAIFGLSRSLSGAFSGWATQRLGYGDYFGITFLLALPCYLLLPRVREWVRSRSDPAAAGAS